MNYIVLFLLFGLPFLVFPIGPTPFETIKVIVAEALILILGVIYILTAKKLSFDIKSDSIKVLVALIVVSIIGLISLSADAFFGNPFRLQGIFLLWILISWAVVSYWIRLNKTDWIILGANLFLLSSALFLSNQITNRAIGTLGEPNALAATALFFWPFLFFKAKAFKIVAAVLGLSVILLSQSRSGLVAFSLQLLFLTLLRFTNLSLIKISLICIILWITSLSLPIIEGGGWFENRSEIWHTALAAGLDKPLFGYGFGNIDQALNLASKALSNNIQYQFVDSSHNFLLDFWVQAGLVGLILIILMLIKTWQRFIQDDDILKIVLMIGLVVVLSFNPSSIVSLIHFWWLIGQGLMKD